MASRRQPCATARACKDFLDDSKDDLPTILGRNFLIILALLRFVPSTHSVSKVLGETIRTQRIKAGLSQEELAEKADLSRNYIGNVERAEDNITLQTLARIAKALNLTIHDITRGI